MFFVLLLTGCAVPQPEAAASLREDFVTEWCDLHSGVCVGAQSQTCDEVELYGTDEECTRYQGWRLSQCAGIDAALQTMSATVVACTEQLRAFDCEAQDFCTDGTARAFDVDECAELFDAIEQVCG